MAALCWFLGWFLVTHGEQLPNPQESTPPLEFATTIKDWSQYNQFAMAKLPHERCLPVANSSSPPQCRTRGRARVSPYVMGCRAGLLRLLMDSKMCKVGGTPPHPIGTATGRAAFAAKCLHSSVASPLILVVCVVGCVISLLFDGTSQSSFFQDSIRLGTNMVFLAFLMHTRRFKAHQRHALAFAALVFTIPSAAAADINITAATPGGLAQAVEAAASGDTIVLSAGRYAGPRNRNITLTKPLTIQSAPGESADSVIIDAGLVARCLTVLAAASGTTLRGITLANGAAASRLPLGGSFPSRPSTHGPPTASRSHAHHTSEQPSHPSSGLGRRPNNHDAHAPKGEHRDLASVLSKLPRTEIARVLERWMLLVGEADAVASMPLALLGAVMSTVTGKTGQADKAYAVPPDSVGSVAMDPNLPSTPRLRANVSCAPAPVDSPSGCSGNTTLTASCGSLTEGSLGNYNSNAACTWVLDPPGAVSLYVSFSMLDLEAVPTCDLDAVSLSESRPEGGSRHLGRFCGLLKSPLCSGPSCDSVNLTALHVSSPLTITLASDSTLERPGFALSWRASPDAAPEPPKPPQPQVGGCLLIEHASAVLDRVKFHTGQADHGGGVGLVSATAVIRGSDFRGNSARFGGAAFSSDSSLWIEGSRFTNNQALGLTCDSKRGEGIDAGGAGLFLQHSDVVVTESDLRENSAKPTCAETNNLVLVGGGLAAVGCNISLSSSVVKFNSLVCLQAGCESKGGGLYVEGGRVSVLFSHVTNNSLTCVGRHCRLYGGGIWSGGASVSMTGSHLSYNSLRIFSPLNGVGGFADGGGLYCRCFNGGNVSVASSRVMNNYLDTNTATSHGGGIWSSGCQVSVSSSHVSSNFLNGFYTAGGGVHSVDGTLSVSSSYVTKNSLGSPVSPNFQAFGGGIYRAGHIFISSSSVSFNLVKSPTGPAFGGGLYLHRGSVSVFSSDMTSNGLDADHAFGGGIFSDGGTVSVSSTNLLNNHLSCLGSNCVSQGGGVFSKGNVSVLSSNVTHNSIFAKGSAEGSGIYSDCDIVSVASSHVSSNYMRGPSVHGGGLCAQRGIISVTSSRVASNALSGNVARGGGFYLNRGFVSVFSSRVSSNSLSHADTCYGGGVYLQHGLGLLSSSYVSSNYLNGVVAAYGGGLCVQNGTISVQSSAVTSNNITVNTYDGGLAFGGGMYASGRGSRLWLIHTNLSSNVAVSNGDNAHAYGGGVYVEDGNVSVTSSYVTRNSLRCEHGTMTRTAGGGVWSSGGRVSVSLSHVSNNSLQCSGSSCESHGGGIFSSFTPGFNASLKFVFVLLSQFHGNTLSAVGEASGAAIWKSGSGLLEVALSNLTSNQASSLTTARGGAIYGASSVSWVVRDCIVLRSTVSGSEAAGGALYCERCTKITLHNAKLVSNHVSGSVSAEGGGFWGYNVEKLPMTNCTLLGNTADRGGGIFLSGRTLGALTECRLYKNLASGLGGGIVLRGGISLRLTNVQLVNNQALLFSDIFAVGGSIRVQTFNSTFVTSTELQCLVQGVLLQLQNASVWTTPRAGVEFVLQSTEASMIMRYNRCPTSSYLLQQSTSANRLNCSTCPMGAHCAGGTNVSARRSHWGWINASAQLTMARCPEGYCCSSAKCSPFSYCPGHRTGFLCGRCEDGFAETLGGVGCQHNSSCNNLKWMLPSALVATLVFVIGLVLHHRGRARELAGRNPDQSYDGGEIEVLVFFFQIVPVVMSLTTREGATEFGQFLFSIFNLHFSSNDSSGICPFQGFSAIQKLSSGAIIPLLCCVWITCFGAATRLVPSFDVRGARRRWWSAGTVGALMSVLLLGYSTMVQTAFTLVACVDLKDHLVLFRAAEVECYQSWQLVMLSLIPLLFLFPLMLVCLVRHEARHRGHSETCARGFLLRTVVDIVALPFNEHPLSHQWGAILMLERLVAIMVSVFVTHPVWRCWILVGLILIMLFLHMLIRPFKRRSCNILMGLSLVFIGLIGGWEVAAAVYIDKAIPIPAETVLSISAISVVLILVTLLLGVSMIASVRLRPLFRPVLAKPRTEPGSTLQLAEFTSAPPGEDFTGYSVC